MESSPVRAQGAASALPPSILVVEDELFIRMVVSDELRDAGYSVIEAVNGDEALTILNSGATIDLLFTDVSMPGSIDGLGLVAFARASFPNLPVVVTSAHLLPADFVACGTPFLSKPCPIEQTLEMIRGQLMQRK
jgi:CheY-like chemotaxis protein